MKNQIVKINACSNKNTATSTSQRQYGYKLAATDQKIGANAQDDNKRIDIYI